MYTLKKRITGLGVYFVSLGKEAFRQSFVLCNRLRQEGISSDFYLDPSAKLKKQLKEANKQDAQFVIIIGENELKKDVIILKDMWLKHEIVFSDGETMKKQQEISIKNNDITALLKELKENLIV